MKSDHILAKLVRSQVTWCQVQEMLARNRERMEQEKGAGAQKGLAAFLEDL